MELHLLLVSLNRTFDGFGSGSGFGHGMGGLGFEGKKSIEKMEETCDKRVQHKQVAVEAEGQSKAPVFSRCDSEGKEAGLASVGSGLSPSMKSWGGSMYSDCVTFDRITTNPSLGEDKVTAIYLPATNATFLYDIDFVNIYSGNKK